MLDKIGKVKGGLLREIEFYKSNVVMVSCKDFIDEAN